MDRRKFLQGIVAGTAVLAVPTLASTKIKGLLTSDAPYFIDRDVEFMYPHKFNFGDILTIEQINYQGSVVKFSKTNFNIDLTSPERKIMLRNFALGGYNSKPIHTKLQSEMNTVFACCILHDAYNQSKNILVATETDYMKQRLAQLLDYASSTLKLPKYHNEGTWIFNKSIIDFRKHEVGHYYEHNANLYQDYINVHLKDDPLRKSTNRVVYHMNDQNGFSIRTTHTYHPPS